MLRDIFPLKNNEKDQEHRIDCGEPSVLELLTGRQQIAFAIKGRASFQFELCFRLYQNQLLQYVEQLEKEYPDAKFSVSANILTVTLQIPYLCDTFPVTTSMTAASYVHNQTWLEVRNATSMVDDIYSRVLEMHIEKAALEGRQHGTERIATATVGNTGEANQER